MTNDISNDLFHPLVWEQAWANDSFTAVKQMKAAGIDPAHSFDTKAVSFNKDVFSAEGQQRTTRILNWIQGQGVPFENASILDIGAASGGFSIPFAQRGGMVTSVEPCIPLQQLLQENADRMASGKVTIVPEEFQDIDVAAKGWNQAFDLVFVSMCPVIYDWPSVEKVLQCASQFCYISSTAGPRENSLVNEVLPLVSEDNQPIQHHGSDMGYLLHLLYLKGYAYESIVTHEMKTVEMSKHDALQHVMMILHLHQVNIRADAKQLISDYLDQQYPSGIVSIQEGGRFGKVLIRLQDRSMYTMEVPANISAQS